jgi:exodeoxyribonuclease VII large subunit
MGRALRNQHLAVSALAQRLQVSHPGARLAQHAQRLDDLDLRLRSALRHSMLHHQRQLETLCSRLWQENPRHRLAALCAQAAALRQRLDTATRNRLNALDRRLMLAARTLDAVSPLATLGRGFAVVKRADDGALLRDAAHAPVGTGIEARLSKGKLRATVTQQIQDEDA